jgi:hypothetical protein
MNTFNNKGELENFPQTQITGNMGGGGGSSPQEQDDTIYSRQTISALFVISEGEIYELPADQIYLNGVKITSYKNTKNYVRLGTPSQEVIPGFEIVEAPHPVNTAIEMTNGPVYIKNVSNTDVSALRIVFTFNSLTSQDDRGNVNGYSVTHRIWVRESETAPWITTSPYPRDITRTEKSRGPFSITFRVNRPAGVQPGDLWGVKIIRVTPDDADSKTNSKCSWTSTIELYNENPPLTYPNTALVGLILKNAIRLGGTMPEVLFRPKGIMVKVPHSGVYNWETKEYTETPWNGVFDLSKRYTSCPAWILYDVLTRSKSEGGLGIPQSRINKFSFFELAVYCDQPVPIKNASGTVTGWESRYELHNQFSTREQARTILTYILAICNADFATDEFGNLTVVFDAPRAASDIVTNSDVIDGVFDYSSNALQDRITSVNVTYNNPNDQGKTDTVTVPGTNLTTQETALRNRYGFQSTDLVLIGCMSKSQAIRKGRWYFYTNTVTTGLLTFRRFFAGMTHTIGQIIKVMDDDKQNVKQQGLISDYIVSGSTLSIVLDRELELEDEDYHILYYTEAGLQNLAVANRNAITNTILLNGTGHPTPVENSSFVITGNVQPTLWRISAIEEDAEKQIYTITCTQYSEDKFSYIDGGALVPTNPQVDIKNLQTPAVTNISAHEYFYKTDVTAHASLIVTWDWEDLDNPGYNAFYQLFWRVNNGSLTQIDGITTKEFEIQNALPGVYEFFIYAYNVFALKSFPATYLYNYKVTASTSTLLPPVNIHIEGTEDVIFSGRDAPILWDYNTLNDTVSDRLLDYVVEIWTSDGLTKKNTYLVPSETTFSIHPTDSGKFYYSYGMNQTDFGLAQRSFIVKVYSRDIGGDLSDPIAATITNPAPPMISAEFVIGMEAAFIYINAPIGTFGEEMAPDAAGYVVHMSTTNGFTPDNDTLVYDGTSTHVSIRLPSPNVTYYFRVAAYDVFGKDGLNYSSQYFGKPLGLGVVTWTFAGLTFKPNDPAPNVLSWTGGTAASDQGGGSLQTINAGSVTWTEGILYIFFKEGEADLQSTTVLGEAIFAGTRILATYEGGTNLKLGNGDAFISGDKILAGTVGAEQLIVDHAIIRYADQIDTAVINTAHINHLGAYKIILETNPETGEPGYLEAEVIKVQTLNAKHIISSSLEKFQNFQYLGDVSIPESSEEVLYSADFTSNQDPGTLVSLNIGFGFGCPLPLTRVKLRVTDSSDAILSSFYLYNRDGQTLESRYFSGSKCFVVTVPDDGIFSISIIVKHTYTSARDFNDPYLDVTERYV